MGLARGRVVEEVAVHLETVHLRLREQHHGVEAFPLGGVSAGVVRGGVGGCVRAE